MISANYGEEGAAGLAVHAGIDVILCCYDLSRAARACEYFVAEAERDAAVRARVEESYRRITQLKNSRLRSFTGAHETEMSKRLALLDHRRIVDEIHGSL